MTNETTTLPNQAIIRKRTVVTVSFVGKPTPATRTLLAQSNLQFDGRSQQWYRGEDDSQIVTEEEVARLFGHQ